jgi:hypothetical protein
MFAGIGTSEIAGHRFGAMRRDLAGRHEAQPWH